LARYDVEYLTDHVTAAQRAERAFVVTLDNGEQLQSLTLLLATGVRDHLPEIEGVDRFYGRGVFHCPYCDGWEVRNLPLAAFGRNAAGLALSLKTWSGDVILCTGGPARLKVDESARLDRSGIRVFARKVARLEGAESLEQIVFADGAIAPCRGLFFQTGQSQRCDLAANLGCVFTRKGAVQTGKLEGTNIPGLFVAGDASKDVQLAIVAAAEGAKAAIAINSLLQRENAQ
jgi:thioredoxin reductase